MLALILFGLVFLLGYFLLLLLAPRLNFTEKIGLSFPIGIGVSTFLSFVFNIFGITLTWLSVTLLVGGMVIVASGISAVRKKSLVPVVGRLPGKLRLEQIFSGLILLNIVALSLIVFAQDLYWPPYHFDTITLYDFRGKLFASTGEISQIDTTYRGSYPLLTSLAHTFGYLSKVNPKIVYALFYGGFLLSFFGILRQYLNLFGAAVFSLLLATTPAVLSHSTIAYTNLPHGIYLSLALIYLVRYSVERNISLLVAGSLLFGLTAWVRPASEPFFLAILALLIIYSIWKKSFREPVIFTGFYLFFELPWKSFQRLVLQVTPYDQLNLGLLSRFLEIGPRELATAGRTFLNGFADLGFIGSAGYLFIILAIIVLVFYRPSRIFAFSLIALLLTIGIWTFLSLSIGVSWGFGSDWEWILGQSMKRLLLPLPAMLIFSCAISPVIVSLLGKRK